MPDTCDTCGYGGDELRVYALPGIPMTIGNCALCTFVGAYPYGILVANTVSIGGMQHAAEWWIDAVFRSLAVVPKTFREFESDVQSTLDEPAAKGDRDA